MSSSDKNLDSHHHKHEGLHNMTWDDFGSLCHKLAMIIWQDYQPEIVVGIAKGGVLVGACLSSALRLDFFPIKLSTRHNEKIVRDEPKWFVTPTDDLAGKRVLLVDDICVTMKTLDLAKEAIMAKKATEVRTATLMIHGGHQRPDWFALDTNALILVPWDLKVILDGEWVINPEFQEELDSLGINVKEI